jgi:hypothetical protein
MSNTILMMGISLLVVCGCARNEKPGPQEQILDRGRQVSQAFMSSLKGRLVSALEEGGPVEAIAVCHRDAAAMTADISAAHLGVIGVKRISPRWRNPANRPDPLDQATWRIFEAFPPAETDEPEDLVVPDPDVENRLVYYRALRMAPLCLTCHGPVEEIPAEVRKALTQRYPDDRAIGFQAGELRGLVRIDFEPDVPVGVD